MRLATLRQLCFLVPDPRWPAVAPRCSQPAGGDPSGRPAAILDDAACAEVWSLHPETATLSSEGQAAPHRELQPGRR
jgi:hypothetical protein